ncbi:hypothetical protein [Rhizobium laguerreae]|nr:hypothetical protein [Rhizobium laguerreae]
MMPGFELTVVLIGKAKDCVVIADSERDFDDIEIVNPLDAVI